MPQNYSIFLYIFVTDILKWQCDFKLIIKFSNKYDNESISVSTNLCLQTDLSIVKRKNAGANFYRFQYCHKNSTFNSHLILFSRKRKLLIIYYPHKCHSNSCFCLLLITKHFLLFNTYKTPVQKHHYYVRYIITHTIN